MRILLLTDIPPTRQLTAGLVLDRLVRFLPRGAVCCFAVVNTTINVSLTEDLVGTPIHYVDKPKEDGFHRLAGAPWLKRCVEWLHGLYHRNVAVPRLVKKAARFARRHKVDAIWVTLQGQTMARMAVPLSRELGVPLFTLVWDPISWWLKANKVGPVSSRKALKAFDDAIQSSRAVATASWAMTEEYDRRYRVFSTPVISSHNSALAYSPPPRMHRDGKLVIGMCGQFYALEEWEQVITALNACNWRIAGREVTMRLAGHYVPESNVPPDRVSALGWLSAGDLIKQMSDCDILYCPYPFAPEMDEVSRLSFPSKLVTYLAAGRPILFHGPANASPGRYIAANEVGVVTLGVFASSVYNALARLAKDEDFYKRCADNASAAFHRDFTLERMRASFFSFLRVDPNDPPSSRYEDVRPIDERNPRVRQQRQGAAASEGFIIDLLSVFPQVDKLRHQARELATWKEVHAKELSGLYAYVKELSASLDAGRAANEANLTAWQQRLAESEAKARALALADREAIAQRDESLAQLIVQRDKSLALLLQRAINAEALAEQAQRDALRAETLRREIAQESQVAVQRALDVERARAETEVAALRAEITQTSVRLQSAMAEATGRVAAAREELSRRLDEIQRLTQQLAVTRQEATLRDGRLDEMQNQVQQLSAGQQDAAARLAEAREELGRRLEEIQTLNHQLEAERREALATREAAAAMSTTVRQLMETGSTLATERDAALRRLYEDGVAVNSRAATFEAEVGALRQQVDLQLARILGKISAIEYERGSPAPAGEASTVVARDAALYLDLVEDVLTGRVQRDPSLGGEAMFDAELRQIGRDRPSAALTMIGSVRMRNLRTLTERALLSDVPGDFIETGVWRGGACIYMRAILAAWRIADRRVFVADSFCGLPPPNTALYPADAGDIHHTVPELAVSLAEVKENFARFGLLDEQVVFLPGWFKDTLPKAPIERIAVLRLDGDMYKSTMDGLGNLYDKVSMGGFIIIDDFDLPNCRQAVEDFRKAHGIQDPIHDIDGAGVFWRKASAHNVDHIVRLGARS